MNPFLLFFVVSSYFFKYFRQQLCIRGLCLVPVSSLTSLSGESTQVVQFHLVPWFGSCSYGLGYPCPWFIVAITLATGNNHTSTLSAPIKFLAKSLTNCGI